MYPIPTYWTQPPRMGDVSRPPTRPRQNRRGIYLGELIFNKLHPAYASLIEKSNNLSADEALFQELKEAVKEHDAQLKIMYDPQKPDDDLATTIVRKARADAVAKIKSSKTRQPSLMREFCQAQQLWETINRPSREELNEVKDKLKQEFECYWQNLKADRARDHVTTMSESAASSFDRNGGFEDWDGDTKPRGKKKACIEGNHVRADSPIPGDTSTVHHRSSSMTSMKSVDITSLKLIDEDPIELQERAPAPNTPAQNPAESDRPTSPEREGYEPLSSSPSPIPFVSKVNDTVSSVLKSIGNLRQRRKKSGGWENLEHE